MQPTAVPPPLTRYGAILTALLSGLAALAIVFVYFSRPDSDAASNANPMQKNAMASQIEYLAETARLQVQAIAAHPQTIACFEASNGEACRNQSANLHALNRDATLDFIQEGNNADLLPGFLPNDTRRLLERAARQKGPTTTAKFSLTVTQPVLNAQNQRIGFVVLEQGMPQLRAMFDTLPLPAAGGYIELLQSQEGEASTLMRRGNQVLKAGQPTTEVALAGTPWKILVWRSEPGGFQVALPYLFAWVLLTLAIAVVVMAVLISISNKTTGNLKVIARIISDMRQNKLRKEYPVSLAEFERPMRYILKNAHLQVGEQKKVTSEATLDHLSQVHNRRSFELKQSELFQTLKDGWTHSLLLLDIDNFKQINDTFGHEAGDQMIVAFGRALREKLRSSDFIARLGGDEFCVIFPYTTLERAEELADRLRANMPQTVELIPGVIQKLAWSGGLSEYSKDDEQENMALSRADAALLEAKRGGRNNTRVKVAA
jgi:diguanylate cyclase (GGDEF)-like protein